MLKNQKGFTLIEMLIVMLIISVLLLLTIPNVVKHNQLVDDKGCDAFVDLVQSQVQLYKLDKGEYPATVADLESDGYVDQTECSNNQTITISSDGLVSLE
ncbi:competence type IV pilus major pilin ComGC [Alkalibacillus salilacus]|uniref:ComG operon protein 3 n=1 Tax=Alkalibacillus salilacus TaxID=284582 RepID=A0ABT9VCD3_9BACI|nr:competence type IV pilus major pilin ComGC [Alkalibacillus salilacus]MDQ0158616.1 competence protein ComGC [Alkalibacillus salilacus]